MSDDKITVIEIDAEVTREVNITLERRSLAKYM